jgi:hypothetical protein
MALIFNPSYNALFTCAAAPTKEQRVAANDALVTQLMELLPPSENYQLFPLDEPNVELSSWLPRRLGKSILGATYDSLPLHHVEHHAGAFPGFQIEPTGSLNGRRVLSVNGNAAPDGAHLLRPLLVSDVATATTLDAGTYQVTFRGSARSTSLESLAVIGIAVAIDGEIIASKSLPRITPASDNPLAPRGTAVQFDVVRDEDEGAEEEFVDRALIEEITLAAPGVLTLVNDTAFDQVAQGIVVVVPV